MQVFIIGGRIALDKIIMPTISTGNLNQKITEHPETKGWVLGHFIPPNSFFHSNDFEVKWAVHAKGETKEGIVGTADAKTFGILVSGKYRIYFPELNQEVVLSQQGDFLTYNATAHIGEALEDTVLLTIRWPSKSTI